ncbi:MAG: 2-C-methyl-D-erythritol 2,4-cyclodiphosphate synthase [Clostridia bacterium]
MRIGSGFDVHAFAAGRKLILGGEEIPHEKGLSGHSDADVLVHALMDAVLGALALGDIGLHFPPGDDRYLNADSMKLLAEVVEMMEKEGYRIGNADMTVIAEKPKMAPHIPAMRRNIAAALKTDLKDVSIKATTTEKLGFTGREEGIAAFASVLLTEV